MAPLSSLPAALLLIFTLFHLRYCHSDIIKTQDQVKPVETESKNPRSTWCSSDDDQCTFVYTPTCGIWLAKSTIPNGGVGMFAGKSFQNNQEMLESGDIVIPIVDFFVNQFKYHYRLQWDDYTWQSDSTLSTDEGMVEVNAASPGFGSCANSYVDLQNVDEWRPSFDNAGLDRTKDPGAGASSAYYNRKTTAKGDIQVGQELFVSYGANWFETRIETLGAIPLKGDHARGQVLLETDRRLQQRLNLSTRVHKEIWQRFMWESPYYNDSRVLNALPSSWDDLEFANKRSLMEMRKSKHRVSSEWLREYGTCMDNMKVAPSTLPQAGRGAFATRFLQKGQAVAPMPLIHMPHKDRLLMYNVTMNEKGKPVVRDQQNVTRHQLLTNYCFGHGQSTLLLCSYGAIAAAVNHNQTLANVKLAWSDPVKTGYHSEWRNQSVESLVPEKSTGLIMDLVATRDIQPGEEIFLDYGEEWEEAWNRHLQSWKPWDGITVDAFNKDFKTPLKTTFEQMEDPYPDGIKIKCEIAFKFKNKWKRYAGSHESLMHYISHEDEYLQDCDLLKREQDERGKIMYTAVMIDEEKGEKVNGTKLEKVPREAFVFVHTPYASDMHLRNAFRHSIMIPDEIFPDAWKNNVVGTK